MDVNKKFLFGMIFLGLLSILFLYINNPPISYGIRPQDFKLEDIERLMITKSNYPLKETQIELTDSNSINLLINTLLKSKKTKIYSPNASSFRFELTLLSKKGIQKHITVNKSLNQGLWFIVYGVIYNGNELGQTLNSFYLKH